MSPHPQKNIIKRDMPCFENATLLLSVLHLPITAIAHWLGSAMTAQKRQNYRGKLPTYLDIHRGNWLSSPIYDRVIVDSSARRFQAHKIYLRAASAHRWVISRANILRSQRGSPNLRTSLKGIDTTLRQELARITDQHVVADLRAADQRAGYWIDDDPSLDVIRRWIQRWWYDWYELCFGLPFFKRDMF